MSDNKLKILANRKEILIKLILFILPIYLLILLSGKINIYLLIGLILASLSFVLLANRLWLLISLALPGLAFGQFINVPITESWVYETSLAELFLILSGILFILNIFFSGNFKKIKFDNITFYLFAYWLLSLGSYFYIVDIHYFIYAIKVATFSLAGYFLALNIFDDKKKIKLFLYSVCATVFILSSQLVYKFYQMGFSTKFFFERNTIQIAIGPLATVSAILVFLIPIATAFYFYENESRRWNPYIFFIFLFGIFAVFLTLSKGAIASLAIALLIIFIKIKPSRPVMVILGSWFVLASFIVLNPFLSGLLERITTTFADKNTKYRFLEYGTGWEIIKNHPMLGVGAGQQMHYFKEILKWDNANLVNNYFFQPLIDLGIIGFGICVTLFSSIFANLVAVYKKISLNRTLVVGFIASFVSAFFNGLVEVTIFALPYAIIFWITLGMFNNIKKYA